MKLINTYVSNDSTSVIPWVLYKNVYIKGSKLQQSCPVDKHILDEWITTNKLIRMEKSL